MAPTFTASDGRRVWELESNVFLVERDAGPGADDSCVTVIFDPHGIAPRLWIPGVDARSVLESHGSEPAIDGEVLRAAVLALVVSLPMWAIVWWAIRALLGGG